MVAYTSFIFCVVEVEHELRRPRNKQRECKLTVTQLLTERHKLVENPESIRIVRCLSQSLSAAHSPTAMMNVLIRVKEKSVPKKRALVACHHSQEVIGVVITGG